MKLIAKILTMTLSISCYVHPVDSLNTRFTQKHPHFKTEQHEKYAGNVALKDKNSQIVLTQKQKPDACILIAKVVLLAYFMGPITVCNLMLNPSAAIQLCLCLSPNNFKNKHN